MHEGIKLGGAALNQIPFNWKNNIDNIKKAITSAKSANIDLLCLPELCITGYGCEDQFLSDWLYDTSLDYLFELTQLTSNITVSFGFPLVFDNKRYNCVCLASDGKILGITPKQHLANDGVHYETRWFAPWPSGFVSTITLNGVMVPIGDLVYEVKNKRVAFEICEDAWRETRPAYHHKNRDVHIILNPSASHFAFAKSLSRQTLVVNSSRDFNCTYVYANLLGNEAGKMIYDGEILIADNGTLLAQNKLLSFQDFNVVSTTEAISQAQNLSKEEEFTRAVSLALFDYLRKSFSTSYILSLSGGADSSTCAILVAEMVRRGIEELGMITFCEKLHLPLEESEQLTTKDAIHLLTNKLLITAYQSTKNSSDKTFEAAEYLARSINAQFHHWSIDEEVALYTSKIESALNRKLNWENDDLALQNIQARSRSPIIWMLTNIHRGLLITTSNRSEGDVGYATMDGDTSGSISPIAGVDKHFIRNWLVWAEKKLGYTGLNYVNELAPSAELRPLDTTQTDEDDLMPYPLLAAIEKQAIHFHKSPLETLKVLNKTEAYSLEDLKVYINRFYQLWARNQWKRERLAPSFHLDDFNVDPRTWCRFPILSGSFDQELKEMTEYR